METQNTASLDKQNLSGDISNVANEQTLRLQDTQVCI